MIRHTRLDGVTGVQTCALPICASALTQGCKPGLLQASQGRYSFLEKRYAANLSRPLPLSPINRQRHSPTLHQDERETRQMGVERLQGNRCPNPLHRGMEVKGCTEG